MGLINCYECDKEVSTNAVCCPKCGNTRFLEQSIGLEMSNLKEKKEREEADKKAQKLGYTNAYEQSIAEDPYYIAQKREDQKNLIIGVLIGVPIVLILLAVVIRAVIRFLDWFLVD